MYSLLRNLPFRESYTPAFPFVIRGFTSDRLPTSLAARTPSQTDMSIVAAHKPLDMKRPNNHLLAAPTQREHTLAKAKIIEHASNDSTVVCSSFCVLPYL
jgi:hypothetical protein